MKTRVKYVAVLLLAAILVGCVPSLHELYTKDTMVYDVAILGDWKQDNCTWHFEGDPNSKEYNLVITEKDSKGDVFVVYMVDLGGKKYLDLFPDKNTDLNVGDWFKAHLIRAHTFVKIEFKDGSPLLSVMDPEQLGNMIEKDPSIIKHEKTQDQYVLTASTYELQAFIKKHTDTEGFWSKPIELTPQVVEK